MGGGCPFWPATGPTSFRRQPSHRLARVTHHLIEPLSLVLVVADTVVLSERAAALAADGMRVIALATGPTTDPDAVALDAVGVIAPHDPLRPSAVDAIARCRDARSRMRPPAGWQVQSSTTRWTSPSRSSERTGRPE